MEELEEGLPEIPEVKDVFIIKDEVAAKQALEIVKDRSEDPFIEIDSSSLGPTLKKRVTRLKKKASDSGKKSIEPELLSAYDVLKLVPPPFDLNNLAKLFEQNAAHNAACKAKAINIVGLGYEWIETKAVMAEMEDLNQTELQKKVKELNVERIKLDDSLEKLNDDEEFNEIMTKVWIDVESLGNGYLEVGRKFNKKVGYIGHIPGFTMRIRANRDGFVQIVGNKYVYFRNLGDSETENPLDNDPNPNEIIHFKKYSPNSTYYGVPDIIAALTAVLGDKHAKEYNIDYFENKAVPRYAFIVKGAKLSPEAEKSLLQFFKNELKGRHHGTLYIPLPATFGNQAQIDATFEKLEVGVQEGSFIKYLQENRQEILMAHRTPPGKVGVFLNMNLAIARDADRTFREQLCRPEQRRVEKKLKKLFTSLSTNFILKFIETDVIDADIQSRIHDRYLRTQVYSPNDVLRELGKPAKKGGDKVLPYGPQLKAGPPGKGDGSQSQQKTAATTKPVTTSPADQTGQRREPGGAQAEGQAKQTGSNKTIQ